MPEKTITPTMMLYPLENAKRFSEKYTKKTTRKSTITNLTQKNYIRIGEECPICYDDIVNKKQAFLTECGHAFHYECIQNYYKYKFFLSNRI